MKLVYDKKVKPNVEEICQETEEEATFSIEIKDGKKYLGDITVVVCYIQIVGGDGNIRMVKASDGNMDFEWNAQTKKLAVDGTMEVDMEEFLQHVMLNFPLLQPFSRNEKLNLADSVFTDIQDWAQEADIYL